jgi:N-acetyl-alpha-D-glucosaminyl L-malate synthase BshA
MMVGEGPEKINAVAQVKALGLEDKIIFLGNSNEIDKILCYSDLFLLPSEKESFGLSALEAMAHGVPIISSNAGGLAEVNKEGFSGYLAPVGDIETMAQKAKSLLTDEEQHAQFRTQAKKQASLFSIENVVGKYEAIYADAIASIRF